jgi:SNF2 family DNA or RNA helicase
VIKFIKQDIKDNIKGNDYKRGLDYFHLNRVNKYEEIHKSKTKIQLYGEVYGNHKYEQNIIIQENELGGIDIHGDCDCPVEYNCKHVVAVCLEYIANHQRIRQPKPISIDNWLQNLKVPKTKEDITTLEEYKDNNELFLTYRLFDESVYNGQLIFYNSKFLKDGTLGKGVRISTNRVLSNNYNDVKQEIDKDVIVLIKILLGEKYHSYYYDDIEKIHGKIGFKIIKKILKTGRCFYDTCKVPLTFSKEVINSNFEFILENGNYKLKSNFEPENYKFFETTPPLVIDIENNLIAEFDIDIALYKQLLNAPKIKQKDILQVYSTIEKISPSTNIKPPEGIKTQTIEQQPIVQIHVGNKLLKVDFDYSGHIVKYQQKDKKIVSYKNLNKLEIIRDLEFEQSIHNQLQNLDFAIKFFENDLYIGPNTTNNQERISIWQDILDIHIPKFQEDGWKIIYEDDFNIKFESDANVVAISEEDIDWFSLSFDLEFGGKSQPIAPLVGAIIDEFDDLENLPQDIHIEVEDNHFVKVESEVIKPILKTIIELLDKKDDDDKLKISPFDAHLIDDMTNVTWKGKKDILELSKKLKNFDGIKPVQPPKALTVELRDYQKQGLSWLNFLHEFRFGGILADDMGLGKTIQTLSHLSRLKENNQLNKPVLIIMPTSLIANWKNEAQKFTPNLTILSLHGADRFDNFEKIKDYDISLTTYNLLTRDGEYLIKEKFSYIVLDEAQKIKNPKTKMYQVLKNISSEYKLALSGTPIENHLGELWSIYNFLMPGFLGSMSFFKEYYQNPVEKENDMIKQELLNKRVKPFMIRRTKEKVASELPQKNEIVKYTQFSSKQATLYESIRVMMDKKVRDSISQKGIGSSQIMILDALLKLRQVCCSPSLLKVDEAKKIKESAKLELFLDLLDELMSENRKILVFSQFTSMLTILEENIKKRKYKYTKLTGSTRNREEAIEKFTKGDASIFLISLKAGGVGLNLVQADTVIHYDPWWNPAVENQATDRAYRIGQTKTVFVYKLIVENTIEQKILELQTKKQAIQDGIYEKDGQKEDLKFGSDELMELLK